MSLIEQSEALAVMGDHLNAIYDAISGAWADYQSYPANLKVVHSRRSRASLVHDHAISRAMIYASLNEQNIEVIKSRELYLFIVAATIAIRFKKFDEQLRTSNQPTGQVWQFKAQLQLPGVPAAHHLEAGYILSTDGQSLAAVHLLCPSGGGVYWDILLTNGSNESVVEDIFSKQVEREEDDEGARVKRRKEATIIKLVKNDNQG